jgi:hypothetical protein
LMPLAALVVQLEMVVMAVPVGLVVLAVRAASVVLVVPVMVAMVRQVRQGALAALELSEAPQRRPPAQAAMAARCSSPLIHSGPAQYRLAEMHCLQAAQAAKAPTAAPEEQAALAGVAAQAAPAALQPLQLHSAVPAGSAELAGQAVRLPADKMGQLEKPEGRQARTRLWRPAVSRLVAPPRHGAAPVAMAGPEEQPAQAAMGASAEMAVPAD